MRLAIIVDKDETISDWQFLALNQALSQDHQVDSILIANFGHSNFRKKINNALYYLFAGLSRIRLGHLSRVPISKLNLPNVNKIRFNPHIDGIWESLPEHILKEIANVDAVIKFGMGLLGQSEKIESKYGVLSYHHGDPRHYRGRPAGFWETFNKQAHMGVIIQQLSNSLDGGKIRSMAFSKVSKISYRKTIKGMYDAGIPLLSKALSNCERGINIEYNKSDTVYKLPSNYNVAKLISNQIWDSFQRLLYGAFIQKRWSVGKIHKILDLEKDHVLKFEKIDEIPKPPGFAFVADPAGSLNELIYCELLNSKTGKGEIGIWDGRDWGFLENSLEGHMSYPQLITHQGKNYLFPEVSGISSPVLLEISESGREVVGSFYLKNLQNSRHVDATLIELNQVWYLFSSSAHSPDQMLNLYVSSSLFGEFQLHPSSPIVIDPRNSRMAGPVITQDGCLYRFAQDCSERYGSSIKVNRITKINPDEFLEVQVGSIGIEGAYGPHTLMQSGQEMWIDFYTEFFSLNAGYLRLLSKFNKKPTK
jgi:hypothetical protein